LLIFVLLKLTRKFQSSSVQIDMAWREKWRVNKQ